MISGEVELNGERLSTGDGAKIRDDAQLARRAFEPSTVTVGVRV